MERRRACYIGGVVFDKEAVLGHLWGLNRKTLVVTGDGRGAEKWIRNAAGRLGLEVYVPELVDVERQVVDIYVQALYGGELVLVGSGFRVKRAKEMLARSNGWPEQVTEL
jgi:hypothetical protein